MNNTSSIVLSVLLLIFLFVGLTSSKNKEYPDTSFKSAIENVMYPAQPKAIFTQTYRDASKAVADIKVYSARGYIVKKCEGTSAGQGSMTKSDDWILVMEKY